MLVLPLAVPLILYVVLSLPSFQKSAARCAEDELSSLLGTSVHLGEVTFSPFNRIVLKDVVVCDTAGVDALTIGHLGAGVSIMESLWNERLTVSYVELIDVGVKLYKDSANAPLNIQPIIDRFKSDGKKESAKFNLAVNLVVIRRSGLSYDVLDAPLPEEGHFDTNHIAVTGFRADISAPSISNNLINVDVKRLGAEEHSGLYLKELTATVLMDSSRLEVNNFLVEIGDSRIDLNDMGIMSPLSPDFNLNGIEIASLETLPETYVILSDFSPFVKGLEGIDERIDIDFEIGGRLDSISVRRFELDSHEREARFHAHGVIENLTRGGEYLAVDLRRVNLVANVGDVLGFMATPASGLLPLYDKLAPYGSLGDIDLLGDLSFTSQAIDFNGSLSTSCGNLDIDCGISKPGKNSPLRIDGRVSSLSFNPSLVDPRLASITQLCFETEADLTVENKNILNGHASLAVPQIVWNGYSFTDIDGLVKFYGNRAEAEISSSSPYLDLTANGGVEFSGDKPLNEFYAEIRKFSLEPFIKKGRFHNYNLACGIDVSIVGRDPDKLTGWLKIEDLMFAGRDGKSLSIPYIELDAGHTDPDSARLITLRSPQADMELSGRFSFKTIGKDIENILSSVYPSLVTSRISVAENDLLDCKLDLKLKEDSILSAFFNLPVDFIYPVSVNSYVKGGENPMLGISLDIPFLRNKNKLIEDSRLSLLIDGGKGDMELTAHTSVPTKNGKLALDITSGGHTDSLETAVSWIVDRDKEFRGNLSFNTVFSRDSERGGILTDIFINRSKMVFNDSTWTINPARIHVAPRRIAINNLSGERYGQSLTINGVVSPDSIDRLVVKLKNIDLDYIFESLSLSDAVQFGGRANGDFYAFSLLSPEPVIYTPRLHVEGLKYNRCVMGDGDIWSYWDNDNKSIMINAKISQANGQESLVDGYIKPMTEELDFDFSANNAPLGFMAPFMSAFTSQVSGRVSGDAHLYGTFKDLDMIGDIFVNNLKIKLDFTDVTYTASDSVHITPGLIKFDNIKLSDQYGKSANLSGTVTHNHFHDAAFKFAVTDARDLLVYDVRENQTEDPWFGRIFGNGGATVTGSPGRVDIDVDMSTAPNSTFTFVLSDAEQAMDYTFITIRDKDKSKKDSLIALDPKNAILQKMNERVKQAVENAPSVYAMNFRIGITPRTAVNLLMDPVGGDKITAYGSGNLTMTYTSSGDMTMRGEYVINRGKYNFTLQDLIIKDFDIREGSKISFFGDPYAAKLDITASYTVTANLSDLDESFLEDRELNRTNVRVDALMFVRGDIRQPEISFDFDFPTLSGETQRKIRSIVSTEDMKNRQIIYLLALNKFYTPDYMSGTHGNELVSVASSTLSSRLSSMLGQLSDNWSIAPAIRSDRHDFSDVEIDVALSSHLLNNRLLLNGNLGYRDKSLNNNSFIGDFDIRYLLNRSGSVMLKAYNRYNDQNYYLKSALTTQGVGIVFKRDFDNIFSFLRRNKKEKKNDDTDSKKEDEFESKSH